MLFLKQQHKKYGEIIKIVNNSFYNYSIKKELQLTKKKEVCPYFFPHYNDTLFWCFYIINYNKTEYELLSKTGFKEEKAFKISFLEKVNQKKELLKNHKIKYALLHNELINSQTIDLITFKCLCIFYELNVIIIKDKLYYEFLYGNEKPIQVIHFKNNKYGLEENVTQTKVNFYNYIIDDFYIIYIEFINTRSYIYSKINFIKLYL